MRAASIDSVPLLVKNTFLGDGPGALVQLRVGEDLLLARITKRSASALGLAVGSPVFAVLKSVAVAPGDVGVG